MIRHGAWYRSRLVDLAVRLLFCCGLLHLVGLFRKYLGRRRLLVLLYHRLAPRGSVTGIEGIELDEPVTADRFEGHLRVLRWFGEPVSLEHGVRSLHDSSRRLRSFIAVTFDDGYRDNYALGRPLWTRHAVPVTLFPAVAVVDGNHWLWWDELQNIIGRGTLDDDRVRPVLELLEEMAPLVRQAGELPRAADRASLARHLFRRMIELPMELRDAVLDELAARLETPRPSGAKSPGGTVQPAPRERLYMNWDELRTLAEEGAHVGGHTMHHPLLPAERLSVAEAEIADCRAALEQRLGRSVTCFAIPNGRYSERDIKLIERAGYRFAVTVEKGVNYPETDPYQVRRISLSWDEPHHLALKLAFADWLFPARPAVTRVSCK